MQNPYLFTYFACFLFFIFSLYSQIILLSIGTQNLCAAYLPCVKILGPPLGPVDPSLHLFEFAKAEQLFVYARGATSSCTYYEQYGDQIIADWSVFSPTHLQHIFNQHILSPVTLARRLKCVHTVYIWVEYTTHLLVWMAFTAYLYYGLYMLSPVTLLARRTMTMTVPHSYSGTGG